MEIKQYISKQPTGYQRNQKSSRNKRQWKHANSKPVGYSKSSSKMEVYSYTNLPQETRRTSNRQPNFTPTTTGKKRRRTTTPKEITRRKNIIKISGKVNEK